MKIFIARATAEKPSALFSATYKLICSLMPFQSKSWL